MLPLKSTLPPISGGRIDTALYSARKIYSEDEPWLTGWHSEDLVFHTWHLHIKESAGAVEDLGSATASQRIPY